MIRNPKLPQQKQQEEAIIVCKYCGNEFDCVNFPKPHWERHSLYNSFIDVGNESHH